jgi:hypothetical protein
MKLDKRHIQVTIDISMLFKKAPKRVRLSPVFAILFGEQDIGVVQVGREVKNVKLK